ncbi:Succinate dehydrogenase/fumarate reductase iron-sulfur protein [Candidatus Magnetomorum sp. HK-1]|nr:Succinate dehydrogenase/fumarate reductase iron-sulfur protein [Candidatus Magnetomorum sp. HK-1]
MKSLTLHISRFNPESDAHSHIQKIENIICNPIDTVLDVLLKVKDNIDSSLAFRYSCKCTICGSCGMRINQKAMLACETRICDVEMDGVVRIEPLENFTVIKDLVVDIEPVINRLQLIVPWMLRDHKIPLPEKEFIIKPDEKNSIAEKLDRCNLCCVCHSDCETVETDKSFVGPISMAKALKLILDPRDSIAEARLRQLVALGLLKHPDECKALCPKNIDITKDIIIPLKKKAALKGLNFS